MSSVLGLPRLKGNSHTVVAGVLYNAYDPPSGVAVSAIDNGGLYPLIIPFNGDFYGIVCETRNQHGLCSVVRSGLSLAVRKDDLPDIPPKDKTYFNAANGYLTNADGVPVNGKIKKLDEVVLEPKTGEPLVNTGALIDIHNASTLSDTPPLPDFNQQDFLAADFA